MLPSNWFHYLWLECSQDFENTFIITLGQFITKVYNIRHTSTGLQTDNQHSHSFCLTVPCWLGCGPEINICSWEPWHGHSKCLFTERVNVPWIRTMGLFYGAGQCILDTANNCNQGYKSVQTFHRLCSFGWERLLAASPSCQCQIWSPPGPYGCTKEIQSIPLDFSSSEVHVSQAL